MSGDMTNARSALVTGPHRSPKSTMDPDLSSMMNMSSGVFLASILVKPHSSKPLPPLPPWFPPSTLITPPTPPALTPPTPPTGPPPPGPPAAPDAAPDAPPLPYTGLPPEGSELHAQIAAEVNANVTPIRLA